MVFDIKHWLGVGGVSPRDNARAHQWQHRLHWVMVVAALLALPTFYLVDISTDPLLHDIGWVIDLGIFAVFGGELLWMLHVSSLRLRYLARNWLSVLIVVAAVSNLFGLSEELVPLARLLRVVLIGLLLMRTLGSLRNLFLPSGLPYVLILSFASLALAGAGFYWLEPTVHSYADGVWLAFATGATVGYGDLVPTTAASRLFAAVMVMMGFAMFSIVTASVAALFIGEDEKALRRAMHHDMKALREEVAQLRDDLRLHRNELDGLRQQSHKTHRHGDDSGS
ncbi:MAG: ion transporter [Gammaproteobacteria bacterium]|nr:ion transporter [Gammaproteobacteria bacterium]